jgi:hypothetical protein
MKPLITLSAAMRDPEYFGTTFGASSFWTWRTVAKIIDDIPLTEPREVRLYEEATARRYQHQPHVRGDGYAFGIAKHMVEAEGFEFLRGDNDTGENYLAALPLLNQKGRVRLPDVESCRKQFASLQRRVVSGHETVTHPAAKSAHDDIAAAVSGCLVTMASVKPPMRVTPEMAAEYRNGMNGGLGGGLGNIYNPPAFGGERTMAQLARSGGGRCGDSYVPGGWYPKFR